MRGVAAIALHLRGQQCRWEAALDNDSDMHVRTATEDAVQKHLLRLDALQRIYFAGVG
jgi:hypothetical protein